MVMNKSILGRMPGPLKIRFFASRFFFCLFFILLTTALAGLYFGTGQRFGDGSRRDLPAARYGEYGRSVDAVIAIDVSKSMFVSDTDKNITRLKQGMLIVTRAVAALPDTRFAIAVSRNKGVVAVPLTWDEGAVLAFLETVGDSSLTGRGTNLESLLDAAAGAFLPSYPSNRVILLVSDGEELTGSIKNAVSNCAQNGIIITSILTGSDEGAPVPGVAVPGSAVQGGEEVISRRDAATMRMAAGQAGGVFIDANH